jgi:hypothetical protein
MSRLSFVAAHGKITRRSTINRSRCATHRPWGSKGPTVARRDTARQDILRAQRSLDFTGHPATVARKIGQFMSHDVVILGVFMADTAHRADRLPRMGETIRGKSFSLGPGGKGSNQAVAAARRARMSGSSDRLGKDAFADMALKLWAEAGVTPLVTQHADHPTGSAFIFLDDATGDNAIIISPGVAGNDLARRCRGTGRGDRAGEGLRHPVGAAARRRAKGAGPRAQCGCDDDPQPCAGRRHPRRYAALCDYVTPNETEAGAQRHRGDGPGQRDGSPPGASCRGALRRPAS